ncbi:putative nucleoredoxin 1 isoform X3 [Apium graveolens]|uniref:putative nucleoredoxin 1 isoform X3 n=1 Tax=Apium graveolens TaxID=4045 RepID=UPI003D7BF1FF
MYNQFIILRATSSFFLNQMGRKIGFLNGGLGLGYSSIVKACGATNFSQLCSKVNQRRETPLSRICNIKDEGIGRSKFNPLMSRMNIAKTVIEIGRQKTNMAEVTNMKQGTMINLPAENKGYLVKYSYDQKIDGGLGFVRGYSTLGGAQSEHESLYSQNGIETPKGSNWTSESKGTSYVKKGMALETLEDDVELTEIKEGDHINLRNLLFTEKRDYLVKNNGQKVKAEELVGKAILLYFVPVYLDGIFPWGKETTTFLIDIYNDLLPNNDFEVIFIAVDDLSAESFLVSQGDLQKNFESIFAGMPWTAIPFSDKASRQLIARKLSVCGVNGGELLGTSSVSFDSEGMVLKRDACVFFGEYGSPGYPFTDKRIEFLNHEDDAVAEQPSLELLLGSPKRDYVISNKGDRVPIHTLKDKVVALYFYEEFYEDGLTNYRCAGITEQLKTAYKEMAEKKENFEVVFLYLYDTSATLYRTNEESFWKTFKTMPWLALPFKDSNHKKLKRIFHYPDDLSGGPQVPTLVIFGPNGEFVDPCGADILEEFGTFAYPFTRKKVAQLETKMAKELKLEMLWDPNTVFRVKKYELQVHSKICMLLGHISPSLQIPLSQFAGKRLFIYFDMNEFRLISHWNQLLRLKDLYLKMKGTCDEFEVIYIKDSSSTEKPDMYSFLPYYFNLPWLVHYYRKGYSLPKELERSFFNLYRCSDEGRSKRSSLVAFDRDGRIVWKTYEPFFDETEFPFHAGDMEEEYMDDLNSRFHWYYYHWSEKIIYRRGEY